MRTIDASVCVIDGEAATRESIESILRTEGMRAECYGSAEEFLAREPREPPGCLVLDVTLPGMSGFELQRELARTELHIPMIFLTARGDISMSVRAVKAGAF